MKLKLHFGISTCTLQIGYMVHSHVQSKLIMQGIYHISEQFYCVQDPSWDQVTIDYVADPQCLPPSLSTEHILMMGLSERRAGDRERATSRSRLQIFILAPASRLVAGDRRTDGR